MLNTKIIKGDGESTHGDFAVEIWKCPSIINLNQPRLMYAGLLLSRPGLTTARPACVQAIGHFRDHKIGSVTCKIAEELPPGSLTASSSGGSSPQPLTQYLAPAATVPAAAADDISRVVNSLLRSWRVVPDRQAALQALGSRPGRPGSGPAIDLVTIAGEVFKGDGEVVARRGHRDAAAAAAAVDQSRGALSTTADVAAAFGPYAISMAVRPVTEDALQEGDGKHGYAIVLPNNLWPMNTTIIEWFLSA